MAEEFQRRYVGEGVVDYPARFPLPYHRAILIRRGPPRTFLKNFRKDARFPRPLMSERDRWAGTQESDVFKLIEKILDDVRKRFERNSEGEYSIAPGSSEKMRHILNAACDRSTPLPNIVPDGEGGLVASWRGTEELLQIVVDGSSAADVIYVKDRAVAQFDVDLAVPAGLGELRRRLFDLIDSIERQGSGQVERNADV